MVPTYAMKHKPTVAYFPRCHGTAETIIKNELAAPRAIIGQRQMAPHYWPLIIPAIQ